MMQKISKPAPDVRDRDASRARLVRAVGKILAKKGFQAIGVNAIAREAGLDKVLIYRYFGGLPELISAFAAEYDFWPSVTELSGGDTEALLAMPTDERFSMIARNYMRAIRKRPMTCEILSWIFIEQSETTKELDNVRQQAGQALLDLAGLAGLDPSIDSMALMAVIGAATNHLCSRAGKIRWFSGMDLSSEKDWQRLETMLEVIIKSVLASQHR